MLDGVIRFSLRHRMLVLAITAFVLVYGWLVLQKLPVDVFPDLNRPTVNVITDAHGMAPEEVEVVITKPIEAVLNGTSGVTKIYSSSTTGISVVRVEFDWGTDLRFARLAVSERLQLARERMPKGVSPFLSPTSSIMGEIQMIGLTAKDQTKLSELRALADWTIRPRLLTIPGVSQIGIIGGDQLQAQVLVNADKLRKKQINILELKERLSKLSEASSGGFIADSDKEWLIRNFGRILNHDEIAQTAVGMHFGYPVLLKDVATVEFAPAPKRGDASISNRPGVILMVQKQGTADTIKLSEQIDAALNDLKNGLPPDVEIHSSLFKQADFIKNAVGNVKEALRDGSIMVALVLILFLLNFRTTVITLTALPVSLLITAIVFYLFGIGINTMTLGGLAIAIGELVDDAIVDVENVFRRLRENRSLPNPKPTLRVVFEASREIRNSIVLATIIVVLVFIPLFALSGVEGRLFTPIGIAYVISLIASLVVSLTLTPVLCSYLLGKAKSGDEKDSWLVQKLKSLDKSILERSLENPTKVICGAGVAVFLALLAIPFMGANFLPSFNEGSAMIEVETRAGISLEASSRLAMQVEQALLKIPEVVSTGRRTGRAEEDDHAAGINHSEFEVLLKDLDRPRSEVLSEMRGKIKPLIPADGYFSISQPITHRLDHVLSGVKSQVAIKILGPDLRILRHQSAEIKEAIKDVSGIVDLRVEGQVLFPQYKIYAMRPDIAKYGIIPGDLMESLEAMLQGVPVTKIIEKDRFIDVYLRLDEPSRKDINAIKTVPVHVLPTGKVVQLGEVADIFETSGPNVIERENLQRRIAIPFNTVGRDLESVIRDVKAKIKEKIKLPQGYFIEIGGQYENQKQATKMVTLLGLVSVLGIFFVLFAHFKSIPIALQIMVNIPLALIGAVIAIFLSDRTISIATLVAFVTLCGIASRNGIMMISHYIHLMKEEGEVFSKQMVIRGSLERLVPVLMTAFSAILALMPLVMAADEAGKEILHPVAVVIVGGLLSSTLLDIFVTPAIFYKFGKKSAERLVNKQPEDEALEV
ncbi:MAG: efflux RND transporter permease subunit [Oligoflexia bacterium]|nr:efflux RND transporter permease subunit [Oligoflexia bacterium]